MAKIQEKMLGQARPGDTTAVSIYSPGDNVTAIITHIFVCNNDSSAHDYRIFCDDDGTTYDQGTALYYDVELAANTTARIPCFIAMNDSSGNLAVRSDAADDLTFTVYGSEIT